MAAVIFVIFVPRDKLSQSGVPTVVIENGTDVKKINDIVFIESEPVIETVEKGVEFTFPESKPQPKFDSPRSESVVDFLEDDAPMEKVLCNVLNYYDIANVSWTATNDEEFYQVIFACDSGRVEEVMKRLTLLGIGSKDNSTMSVVQCSVHFQKGIGDESSSSSASEGEAISDEVVELASTKKSQFKKSIKSRLTVAQVVDGVRFNSLLTFDYVMLLALAGMIAAIGLVENSSVVIVASMLVSPLMGPILGGTFGIMISDRRLRNLGLKSELIGLCICLMCGIVFGIISGNFENTWGTGEWPTIEMKNRGDTRCLWVGVLIALPSGAGAAMSILGGNQGSLVGVAISASLLPPAVNAGILWGLAALRGLKSLGEDAILQENNISVKQSLQLSPNYTPLYEQSNMAKELALLGLVSLCLTIINILCIFIMGIIVLKIKEVAPYTSSKNTAGFWKHDIKTARDYNKTVKEEDSQNLGKQFLEEWAALNKIDPKRAMAGDADDNQAAQIAMTFQDIVEEIEDENNYAGVLRGLPSQSMPTPISRQIPTEWRRLDRQTSINQTVLQAMQTYSTPKLGIHLPALKKAGERQHIKDIPFGSPTSPLQSPSYKHHYKHHHKRILLPAPQVVVENEPEEPKVPATRFRVSKPEILTAGKSPIRKPTMEPFQCKAITRDCLLAQSTPKKLLPITESESKV